MDAGRLAYPLQLHTCLPIENIQQSKGAHRSRSGTPPHSRACSLSKSTSRLDGGGGDGVGGNL